ncbi:uncharacterized protein [Aristolochia californica]|uniref:uncharacterized protein n=1 Tax=Aristolochia californica TaxID=171875 RepID=UPI0035D8F713
MLAPPKPLLAADRPLNGGVSSAKLFKTPRKRGAKLFKTPRKRGALPPQRKLRRNSASKLVFGSQIFSSKEEGQEESEQKSKTDQAKELLAKYGGAYLATSISLSIVSFTLCYLLISAGVDVAALLQKVGITANEAGEKVGTFALAYAAHKAASPIRFPPTVALTPLVSSWIGGKKG